MPTTMSNETIQKYLNADLLQELGMDAMSPEEAVAFFDAFGSIVWQRIVLRLNDMLNEEQQDKLDALLANEPENAQAVGTFLTTEVPGFEQMVDEEVAGYKKDLMERTSTANTDTPA